MTKVSQAERVARVRVARRLETEALKGLQVLRDDQRYVRAWVMALTIEMKKIEDRMSRTLEMLEDAHELRTGRPGRQLKSITKKEANRDQVVTRDRLHSRLH